MTRSLLTSILASCLFLLFLAAPARADEDQAEALFHQAYIQEVVSGQVSTAAVTYLELAGDESAPPRIRAEARFRFAVCATLLGRADEARTWLASLVADESAPAGVRERAQTYLDSVSSVGIGTELEKKLQDLVFQLGRAEEDKRDFPVYRDFEILGDRAVPFLKQLLHHEDGKIRQHAFRILCRMDEPGMGAAWHPGISWHGRMHGYDLRNYFSQPGHEQEQKDLEANILKLEGDELVQALGSVSGAGQEFSLDFARALARREAGKRFALTFYPSSQEADESWEQLHTWLYGDDDVLAERTATYLNGGTPTPPPPFDASLFPGAVAHVLASGDLHFRNDNWLQRQEPAALLDAFQAAVDSDEGWDDNERQRPLESGLIQRLEGALRTREMSDADLARFEKLYRRWVTAETDWIADRRRKNQTTPRRSYQALAYLLERLPIEQASALVTWVLTDVLKDAPNEHRQVVHMVPTTRPEHVPVFLAAMRHAEEAHANMSVQVLASKLTRPDMPVDVRGAFILALPDIAEDLTVSELAVFLPHVPEAAKHVSRDAAVEALSGFLTQLTRWSPSGRASVLDALFLKPPQTRGRAAAEFVAPILVPAAEATWDSLPPDVHATLLSQVARLLVEEADEDLVIPEGRQALAHFLAAHLHEAPEDAWPGIASVPELIPLETWIPLSPMSARSLVKRATPEQRDAAARVFLATDEVPNASVLYFMSGWPSEPLPQTFYDALLRSDDPQRYHAAIEWSDRTSGNPASAEAWEAVLAALLAEEDYDLERIGRVTRILALRNPSEKLYPAVRVLLSVDDRKAVLDGIEVAYVLGQAALLPDLVSHLGSMDLNVRQAAKRAVDSIQEIQRIQTEAAARAAGLR